MAVLAGLGTRRFGKPRLRPWPPATTRSWRSWPRFGARTAAATDRLEAQIRASENAELDQAFGGWSAEMLADAKDYLTAEQFASIEPFIAASKGDVSRFLVEYGPKLIGEFFNVDDIKGCFSGKVLSCLILVAEQLSQTRRSRP